MIEYSRKEATNRMGIAIEEARQSRHRILDIETELRRGTEDEKILADKLKGERQCQADAIAKLRAVIQSPL